MVTVHQRNHRALLRPAAMTIVFSAIVFGQSPPIDLFGGLEKERNAAFDTWQKTLAAFDATFFPTASKAVSNSPVYCNDARFTASLRQLRATYQASYDKQTEYYRRWLADTSEDISSVQVSIARIEEQNTRLQNTLLLKEREVQALGSQTSEIEQLVKEDPERGKAVQAARQRAFGTSQASLEQLKNSTFNRTSARKNREERLDDLNSLKREISLSIDALNADKEFQLSYYDLRESEVDLRCNKNVRPKPPLLGSPLK